MNVYYTSPWIPAEWIAAHGLQPRGIWFAPELGRGPLTVADGVCPFAQTVIRFSQAHPGSAMVFSTHCDQLRRSGDAVSQGATTFLFNLPATWQTPAAETLFVSELRRLGRFLVKLGGHAPSVEELSRTLAHYARARKQLRDAAPACAGLQFAEALAQFYWDGSTAEPLECGAPAPREAITTRSGSSALRSGAVPLALLGGPLPRSQWDLFHTIERAGGSVALNATEAGECPLRIMPDESSLADPLMRLAHAYLAGCADVFQRPNTRLYAWLNERLAERKIRGIVLWHYLGCDLWRAEAQSLREAFGLPLLPLDATEVAGGSPRNSGRIEAFLESLR